MAPQGPAVTVGSAILRGDFFWCHENEEWEWGMGNGEWGMGRNEVKSAVGFL